MAVKSYFTLNSDPFFSPMTKYNLKCLTLYVDHHNTTLNGGLDVVNISEAFFKVQVGQTTQRR